MQHAAFNVHLGQLQARRPPTRASHAGTSGAISSGRGPRCGVPLVAASSFSTSAETRCFRSLIVLSNVRGAKNPATPATARGRFSDSRPYETNCLVRKQAVAGRVPETTRERRKRAEDNHEKAGNGHGNISPRTLSHRTNTLPRGTILASQMHRRKNILQRFCLLAERQKRATYDHDRGLELTIPGLLSPRFGPYAPRERHGAGRSRRSPDRL